MKVFGIVLIVVLSLSALTLIFFALKSHRFFKTLLFNSFLGLCTLAILNLTARLSGIYIPVNLYSVGFCGIFGVPAVIMLLLLQIILI